MQILLTCDNTDEKKKDSLFDYVIDNFGLDHQLQLVLNGVKKRVVCKNYYGKFKPVDT